MTRNLNLLARIRISTITLILGVGLFADAFAQQLKQASQAQMTSLSEEINDGTLSEGRKTYHAFVIKYQGNINELIANLSKSVGAPEILHENPSARQLKFRRMKKQDWDGKKLTLGWMSMSNQDNHLISIMCEDNKHNDYLSPSSAYRDKIKGVIHLALAESKK